MKKQIMNFVYKNYGRTGLLIGKHSPEILMATGIVGVVTSTVLACRATLNAEEVIEHHRQKLDIIEEACDLDADYAKNGKGKDLVIANIQTGVNFAKLYGPSATLGVLSICCILGAHNIMKKRNLALMMAYKAVEEMYDNYRKRVIEEHGEEADYMYRHGIRKEKTESVIMTEDGKSKKVKAEALVFEGKEYSVYAKFFDETCTQWDKRPEYNLMFLKSQENYYNNMLKVKGHVFLNEIYDALGIERTSAGALVGWVAGDGADNYIDFGMYDQGARRFINGLEPVILLDFNVDGVIYDKI